MRLREPVCARGSAVGFLPDGRLVLFDFGLASLWPLRPNGTDAVDDAPRPLTGETGSLRYMAPEVALSQPYNYKAEVFSYASVVWELGALQKPYEALSPDVFMRAIGSGHRPTVPKKWPQDLHQLFGECWALEADARPDFRQVVPRMELIREAVRSKEKGSNKRSPKYLGHDLPNTDSSLDMSA